MADESKKFNNEFIQSIRKRGTRQQYNDAVEAATGRAPSKITEAASNPTRIVVKGQPEIIDTKQILKVKSGPQFERNIKEKLAESAAKRAARKAASKGIKSVAKKLIAAVPFVGSLAAGIMSDDASAAIPVLGEAESLGPEKGSLDYLIENPPSKPEERRLWMQAMERLRNKQ